MAQKTPDLLARFPIPLHDHAAERCGQHALVAGAKGGVQEHFVGQGKDAYRLARFHIPQRGVGRESGRGERIAAIVAEIDACGVLFGLKAAHQAAITDVPQD